MSFSTKPLFVDADDLLKSLRLQGVASEADTSILQLVDDALQQARIRIVSKIGEAELLVLSGIPYEPNRTDNASLRRGAARQAEINLVRYYLMPHMRVYFGQGLAEVKEDFNDQWLLSLDEEALQARLQSMRIEVDAILEFLEPEQDVSALASESPYHGSTVGPDHPYRVGSSIYSPGAALAHYLVPKPGSNS